MTIVKSKQKELDVLEQLNSEIETGIDLDNRIIRINTSIDEKAFDRFDVGMNKLESLGRAGIVVKINSEGGETYHAMSIVGRMLESKCQVTTKGYGMVESAATLILAAGKKRMMSRFGCFMWHEGSATIDGRVSQLEAELTQFKEEERLWCDMMAQFSYMTDDFWAYSGRHLDEYFSPQRLLELGVVDKVF